MSITQTERTARADREQAARDRADQESRPNRPARPGPAPRPDVRGRTGRPGGPGTAPAPGSARPGPSALMLPPRPGRTVHRPRPNRLLRRQLMFLGGTGTVLLLLSFAFGRSTVTTNSPVPASAAVIGTVAPVQSAFQEAVVGSLNRKYGAVPLVVGSLPASAGPGTQVVLSFGGKNLSCLVQVPGAPGTVVAACTGVEPTPRG